MAFICGSITTCCRQVLQGSRNPTDSELRLEAYGFDVGRSAEPVKPILGLVKFSECCCGRISFGGRGTSGARGWSDRPVPDGFADEGTTSGVNRERLPNPEGACTRGRSEEE